MARSAESFAAKTARRAKIEFGRLRRALQSAAIPPREVVRSTPAPPCHPDYNRPGSHEYGCWQPAIPGSWRWLKQHGY